MPIITVIERIVTDTANSSTTATGIAKSGGWLSNHSTDNIVKRSRDTLHLAMNILHAAVNEGIPLPEKLMFQLRNEHEKLTSLADNIEKKGAKISFLSLDGLVASAQLNWDAHRVVQRAEKLRYKIQRASDIAKNLRMGKGSLAGHCLTSTLSLVSVTSTGPNEVGATTELVVMKGQSVEVQNAPGGTAAHNQTTTNYVASTTNTVEHETADPTSVAAMELRNERAAHLQSIQEEETSVLHSETTTSADALSDVDMTITVEQQIQDADLTTEEGESNDSERFCINGIEITEIVVDVEPNPWCD